MMVTAAVLVQEGRGGTDRDRSHLVRVARVKTLGRLVTQELQSLLLQ